MTKDLKAGEKLAIDKLIDLYDSHGLNPEIAKEFAPNQIDVPDNFYMQVAKKHEKPEAETVKKEDFPESMPSTRMLYYEDAELTEFEAKVVALYNDGIVLDQTAFYPEGGGQEWDLGILNGHKVTKVIKAKTAIMHFIDGPAPKVGDTVKGHIDMERRLQLMRHHTAAHLINGCARALFGNHVWQAGAHKAVEEARLDITHFENLSVRAARPAGTGREQGGAGGPEDQHRVHAEGRGRESCTATACTRAGPSRARSSGSSRWSDWTPRRAAGCIAATPAWWDRSGSAGRTGSRTASSGSSTPLAWRRSGRCRRTRTSSRTWWRG